MSLSVLVPVFPQVPVGPIPWNILVGALVSSISSVIELFERRVGLWKLFQGWFETVP